MILATDHPDAPMLMSRAYGNAVKPKETHKQLSLLPLDLKYVVEDSDKNK